MDQHKWRQGMVSLLQEPPDNSLLPFDGLGSRGMESSPSRPNTHKEASEWRCLDWKCKYMYERGWWVGGWGRHSPWQPPLPASAPSLTLRGRLSHDEVSQAWSVFAWGRSHLGFWLRAALLGTFRTQCENHCNTWENTGLLYEGKM